MILHNDTSAIYALNTTNESINKSFTTNIQDNLDNTNSTPNNDQQHNDRDLSNPHPAADT
jgi:hypothetical protein